MSTPLLDVWEAAASSPFYPTVSKGQQFTVGFLLLVICMWRACPHGEAVLTFAQHWFWAQSLV